MKTLVGITRVSSVKDYMFPEFQEMLEVCVRPVEGVDIVWASDKPICARDEWLPSFTASSFVEDILIDTREQLRLKAIEGGYDKLVWQGMDAPYQSREDFERLISHDLPIVAPLINARMFDNAAVARRFFKFTETESVANSGKIYSDKQYDIPREELLSGKVIESGFPGGDNIALRADTFDISWVGKHTPWYERVAQGRPNIDCIEWFCLEALNRGQQCYVDTSVSVWHVAEDRTARMYPGIVKNLGELSW